MGVVVAVMDANAAANHEDHQADDDEDAGEDS